MTKSIKMTLRRRFTKADIMDIADELAVSVAGSKDVIITTILADLDEEGIPDAEDCGDLMTDFLIVAEYCDEDGNILEVDDEEEETEGGEVAEETVVESFVDTSEWECYGYHSDRDPACRRCTVREECAIERLNCRPECFGLMFDENDEECGACIEAHECKQTKEK